jgi:uncharacterized protein (TIGR02246 family)
MGSDAAADHDAIHAVALALQTAVNAGDIHGILACWTPTGVLLPPHHPAVHGHAAIAAYFSSVFAVRRLTFTFSEFAIESSGDVAVERLSYSALATPLAGGPTATDVGKGLHVCRRGPDGIWRLEQDIWNSDRPIASR